MISIVLQEKWDHVHIRHVVFLYWVDTNEQDWNIVFDERSHMNLDFMVRSMVLDTRAWL